MGSTAESGRSKPAYKEFKDSWILGFWDSRAFSRSTNGMSTLSPSPGIPNPRILECVDGLPGAAERTLRGRIVLGRAIFRQRDVRDAQIDQRLEPIVDLDRRD